MKAILNIAVVCLLATSLSACAYFDTEAGADNKSDKKAASQTIDLTNASAEVPVVETPHVIQPPQSVSDIVRNSTGGSVDVLSLDGPGYNSPQPAPQPAYSYVDQVGAPETVYSGDPSVEVYSLDGPVFSSNSNEITPMPDMQVPPINVVHANDGSLAVVYFEHGQTKLNSAAKAEVERFTVVRNPASTAVAVEGHASIQSTIADPVKRKMANLRVSMERAISVTRELVGRGVPPDNITTVAHGEARAGQNDDQSRRVEIRAISGQ